MSRSPPPRVPAASRSRLPLHAVAAATYSVDMDHLFHTDGRTAMRRPTAPSDPLTTFSVTGLVTLMTASTALRPSPPARRPPLRRRCQPHLGVRRVRAPGLVRAVAVAGRGGSHVLDGAPCETNLGEVYGVWGGDEAGQMSNLRTGDRAPPHRPICRQCLLRNPLPPDPPRTPPSRHELQQPAMGASSPPPLHRVAALPACRNALSCSFCKTLSRNSP